MKAGRREDWSLVMKFIETESKKDAMRSIGLVGRSFTM
jgi:hypothetical protein